MKLARMLSTGRAHTVADATNSNDKTSRSSRVSGMFQRLCLVSAAAIFATLVPSHAQAQTAPAYVVFSQYSLLGTGSPNPNASFGGFRGHAAFNSRGDLFASDGGGQHVYEYPANGGGASLIFTDTAGNQFGGTAVDPFDNLYIGVFTYNGPSGNSDQNSLLYEFPITNNSYQGLPYIFNQTSPPGSCIPPTAPGVLPAVLADTTVCSVGFYQGSIYYYWQGPFDTAVDGSGNIYTISGYTSHDGSDAQTIQQCQAACAEQIPGNGASDYTGKLPNSVQSLATDYAGDLFFADDAAVYIIPAGSPSTSNVPTVYDSGYTTPYGVSFDPSGNLYVADANGIWEVPSVEASGAPCKGGADVCVLLQASKYILLPLKPSGTPALYSSYLAPTVDNRGHVVFSPNYGQFNEYTLWGGNFASAQIGSTASSNLGFTVSFDATTTIASVTAVQGSAPATEFAVVPGTCAAGVFAAGSTCTFSATFTPTGLGIRTGAVVITDSTGKSTYTYLTGTGTGTGVSVDPGTPSAIGSGFKKPEGLAVDTAGNVYVADPSANKVQEFPAGGGTAISVGTGLSVPTGVAVDGAGNVFIVNQGTAANTGSIVEVPNLAGVLTNTAQKTLASGLNLPSDIVADGNANLYVTTTGGNQLLQLANPSRDSASAAIIPRGYGLSAPTGVAIDASGNLFVADTGNNRVLEISDGSQVPVGSGLTAPTGVTVDPSGSIIIADGTGRIIRVPNESFGTNAIGLNAGDQQVLSSPLSYPYALRLDSTGNLYVSDNVAGVVDQLQRTTGSINFGNWNLNTVSDAQTIVLSNSGTADLTIGNPVFPAVPAASEFAVTTGSGSSACGSGLFHSGYNCVVQATFDPTVLGSKTYPLIFSTTATNTTAPTVNLVGTGVNEGAATFKLVQTAPTTPTIIYGQQIIIAGTVTASVSGGVQPTGNVVFNFDGQPSRAAALNKSGIATITFNGLNAGNNTLCAYYGGDANYASMNATCLPLNIQQATELNVLTIVGDSATPLSAAPANNFTLTDTLTPSVVGAFGGSVNFVDTTTGQVLNPTPIRLGSPDPKTGLYSVSFSISASSSSLGTPSVAFTAGGSVSGNIVAQFSGNTDYVGTTSNSLSYTVSAANYTITPPTNTVTATAATPGIVNLVVTDYSNFQGSVALTCTGLPANAYCVFLPGDPQLTPAPGPVQNTQLTPLTIYPVPVTLAIKVDENPVLVEGGSIYWIGGLSIALLLVWRRRSVGKLGVLALTAVLCIAGLTTLNGCGSSSNGFPTPTGTYAVTIVGTASPSTSNGGEPPCVVQANCPVNTTATPNVIRTVALNLTVK